MIERIPLVRLGLITLLSLLASGCHHSPAENSYMDVGACIEQWVGKVVDLPDTIGWFTTDGISANTHFPSEDFKIVRYVGAGGCTSCRLRVMRYGKIVKELSDSAKSPIGFVCIVNPKEVEELQQILHRDNLAGLTMWIDSTDTINKINGFPAIESLQTFLIDRDNRVLAIGDPAINPKVMQLYTRILTNDTINIAHMPQTRIHAESDNISLGAVRTGDVIRQTIQISNIGDHDFVLDKILTSCDCTTAYLSTQTIPIGGEALLTITCQENNAIGDFYREIYIFGNIAEELTIEINGSVK